MEIERSNIWDKVSSLQSVTTFNFEESAKRRVADSAPKVDTNQKEALNKVEEAKDSATKATFRMMDRHNEMVKKSQELANVKARRDSIDRRNKLRREEHTELLAEMAVENAQRSKWTNKAAMKRRPDFMA